MQTEIKSFTLPGHQSNTDNSQRTQGSNGKSHGNDHRDSISQGTEKNQQGHKIIHTQRSLLDGEIKQSAKDNNGGRRLMGTSFAHHPHTEKQGVEIHRSINAEATTVDQAPGRLLRRGLMS
jgi:hypothetical protein